MNNAFDRDALGAVAGLPVPADLLRKLEAHLQQALPQTAAAELVSQRLQQFILAARSPTSLLAFFERDEAALDALLRLLGTGQPLADQLAFAPEALDLIRVSQGAAVRREVLIDEIVAELDSVAGSGEATASAAALVRSLIGRERLRIAYSEWVADPSHPRAATSQASAQLTVLADAVCQAVLDHVSRQLAARHGWPQTPQGQPAKIGLIGLGSWAAGELSYGAPLEAFFLCQWCGPSDGPESLPGDEFFRRLVSAFGELLADQSQAPPLGAGDGVSLAQRPLGAAGPSIVTVTEAERHYQLSGRTWERLMLVKSRLVAGDESIGKSFFAALQPWVYRRYFRQEDSDGLRTTLRKRQRRLDQQRDGDDLANCLAALDDLETIVVIQQIVRGSTDAAVRVVGTSDALQRLLAGDHLTVDDAARLEDAHSLLRRCRHLLEVAGLRSLDTISANERAAAAWNLGYQSADGRGDVVALKQAIESAIRDSRQVLQRLLRETIDDPQSIAAESELVLDPDPDPTLAAEVLSRYGLPDPQAALRDLQRLAVEPVPFLSTRRCRHHLAAIAPQLLHEVSETPDPHHALTRLADVGDSLGGKAVLWELFRVMPRTMTVFIRMCAGSPYLSGLLIQNPGMVDELIDSLELDRLPTEAWLDATAEELCRGGADVPAVLGSFKNAAHLQIGVRDCLRKDRVEETHEALAATAEAIIRCSLADQQTRIAEQFGDPCSDHGDPIEGVMLALGKLGGREPNYHSTLSLALLYTANGQTQRRIGGPRATTTTQHFYNAVASGLIQTISGGPSASELYRLRWPGLVRQQVEQTASPQALLLDAVAAHFLRGQATLTQRLELCQARPISGSPAARQRVRQAIVQWLGAGEWFRQFASQIRQMRLAAEVGADPDNLKRAAGGTLDVELLTQTLQLCHARNYPEILVPETLQALQRIEAAGLIDEADSRALQANYRTLRDIESKIRLLDSPQRHSLPRDPQTLQQLAYLMQPIDAESIVACCQQAKEDNRRRFSRLFDQLAETNA